MRIFLLVLCFLSCNPAFAFERDQQVFDTVTEWYYVISGEKDGSFYITTHEEGFRDLLRKPEQLIAGVENLEQLKLGQQVTYYNSKLQFMQTGKIIALFPNGLAFLYAENLGNAFAPTKTVRIGTSLLGIETAEYEGIKAGDKLCAKEELHPERGSIGAGTTLRVKKVFTNGSAEVRVGWLYYPEILAVRDLVACE